MRESRMQASEMLTSEDDSVLRDYTIFRWISLHHFEFNCPHATTDEECIAFANGTVSYGTL